MDPRRTLRTDPCGSKVQRGPCAMIGAGPGLPPQLTVQEPPSARLTEQRSESSKAGAAPAALACISRPRPTALGTKPAPKVTRSSADPSKDKRSVPPCIPGPQSSAILPHSTTETSSPLSSPHSPQTPSSQPYLSPSTTLSPPPGLSPQQQRKASPESSAQVQADQSGEAKDFRSVTGFSNSGCL